jgi:small nuclear ribonucleoprotein (snRNP)-like protein
MINLMKKIVISSLVLILMLFLGYKYLYHEHRDIATEKAAFSVTVNQILKEFVADETKANAKYLDKSITVKGKITTIDSVTNSVVLDEKVFVLFTNSTNVKLNENIVVQGRLIGYDSLLEEIKIDQAQIK